MRRTSAPAQTTRPRRHRSGLEQITFADLKTRLAAERDGDLVAAMDADTVTLPVVVDAEIVDPEPTLPQTRAELLVDLLGHEYGDRPLHDLDYALRTGGVR